ncbi:hypothetical protein D8674_019462 [Pyrus ussuriensis x Pyrus communis]|uniref:Uncharacterized protein n=1 Tax=Pyrus ussuriensis x Pyrus communis TaxID=2448454 RepID=A0A5N5GD61_9ROSA|nr:hypothetical protein D8674_019462 [Pyrus ussuriensis x Pyrus communis]
MEMEAESRLCRRNRIAGLHDHQARPHTHNPLPIETLFQNSRSSSNRSNDSRDRERRSKTTEAREGRRQREEDRMEARPSFSRSPSLSISISEAACLLSVLQSPHHRSQSVPTIKMTKVPSKLLIRIVRS